MSNAQLLDLFTRIFKRTSDISDEVVQMKKDLIEMQKILKPVHQNDENVEIKLPAISSFTNKITKVSINDLFVNDDKNKSSLLDLTNSNLNNTNIIKKAEPKSNATTQRNKNKDMIIKQSPLKTVFPQYFYSRTPTKSPSMISKYGQVVISENNENKSNKTQSNPSKIKRNSIDLNNEIPSPKKMFNQPKLKQLTMTQAFTTQLNSPKKFNQSVYNENEDIKPQRMDFQDSFCKFNNSNETLTTFKNISNFQSTAIDPNETCLPSQFNVKNEPVEFDSTRFEADDDQTNNEFDNEYNREYFADFNKVPKKKSDSPNYKHVQVVRKQDERKKLGVTSTCKECENYWNSLPEDKRPLRMNELCRHRSKYQAPATPEHYWSIEFPTREECLERGYGGVQTQNDKDDTKKRPRRKRPLKLNTPQKKNDEILSDLEFDDDI